MIRPVDRLPLFPDGTTIEDNRLKIGGHDLSALADAHGTPLYIVDRTTLDASVARYRRALKSSYPGASSITYAGKAFLCTAIAQWTDNQRIGLDCTGEAEISMAAAAGVHPASIVVHGVNKSAGDLASAVRHAGTLVVDNLSELSRIAQLLPASTPLVPDGAAVRSLWLRLQPGVSVETHHPHTVTGQSESKFGMPAPEIEEAAQVCRASGLPLDGLHFHLGSNFRDTAPLAAAIDLAVRLAKKIGLGEAWHFCPGGGLGVAYHEDELPAPELELYVQGIARELTRRCRTYDISLPTLHLEPGRSLVARAGVAIYRVGAIKRRRDRTWLLTDGGMTDNPRHALYGARYTCLPVKGLGRDWEEHVSVAGPCCESGDVVIEDLPMPPIEQGELIAIPVSGAYHLSMSSNYNGIRRPPVVWLERGRARLIIRRETVAELTQRYLSLA